MRYFVVQDWETTKANHAGMAHLCKSIKKLDPENVKIIVVPHIVFNKGGRLGKDLQNLLYSFISIYVAIRIKKNDKLFLMEYFSEYVEQYRISKMCRRLSKKIRIYALAHHTPEELDLLFPNDKEICKQTQVLDKLLTLGSSLTAYFIKRGVSPEKMVTTFHYVDVDYYNSNNIKTQQIITRLNAIIIGNVKRNYHLLYEVFVNTPGVHFTFCISKQTISDEFRKLKNVSIVGYVSEDKLKSLMAEADVSLNVLYYTVGSNAITTSMAMGLVVVANDVGSIRDYCNEDNSILCDNDSASFSKALNYLQKNTDVLISKKTAAVKAAQTLSIENFYQSIIAIND
ncbi:glycosyltransferase [Mucilaginibacter sp. HD30]